MQKVTLFKKYYFYIFVVEIFRPSPVAFMRATLLHNHNLCPISQKDLDTHCTFLCVLTVVCCFVQENSHLSSEMDSIHPWEVSFCCGCSQTSRHFLQILCFWITNKLRVTTPWSWSLSPVFNARSVLYWQIFLSLSWQKMKKRKQLLLSATMLIILLQCETRYSSETRTETEKVYIWCDVLWQKKIISLSEAPGFIWRPLKN